MRRLIPPGKLRDQLRRAFPAAFAIYKHHVRRHIAHRDSHYAIAEWVIAGHTLRTRLKLADVTLDADGAWFIDQRGLQWRFAPEIWGSTLGAATRTSHEPGEIAVACSLLDRDSVAIDVGANVGAFALPVTLVSGARVIAIEPVSSTLELLRANVHRNRAQDSVTTLQAAIGDGQGHAVMTTGGQAANYMLMNRHHPHADEEQVKMTTLDAIAANEARVDLIKVDVEGSELAVMRGARETLARHSPAVLLEIERRWTTRFGYSPEELFAFMERAGYGYQPVTPDGPVQPTNIADDLLTANNFFFTRRRSESTRGPG